MKDLTTKQAAIILEISASMVGRLYRQGKLNGYKINPSCLMVKQDAKFRKMERYYGILKEKIRKSKEVKNHESYRGRKRKLRLEGFRVL